MVEVFRERGKAYKKNTVKSLLHIFQSHPVVLENCEIKKLENLFCCHVYKKKHELYRF